MDEESIQRSIDTSIRSYKMLGLVLIILGIVGILFPLFIGGIIVLLIAFSLILVGGMYLGVAIYGADRKGMTWLKAIVFLTIGLLVIIYPYEALATLALLMAVLFIAEGILAFVLIFVVDDGKIALAVNGIVGLILGALLLIGWPGSSKWIVGLFVGIYLLMEGLTMIAVGRYLQDIRE